MALADQEDRIWDELIDAFPWVGDLDRVRQEVILNIAYHLGVQGLYRFKNTMEFTRQGKYNEAADEIAESLWAKQSKRAGVLSRAMRTGGSF